MDKIKKLFAEMRTATETLIGETVEAKKKELQENIDKMGEEIKKRVDDLEEAAKKSQNVPGLSEALEKKSFDFQIFFYNMHKVRSTSKEIKTVFEENNGGYEYEVLKAISQQRGMSTIIGEDGGFIVNDQVLQGSMIEFLKPKSTLMKLGPTVFSNLTGGQFIIGKQTDDVAASWGGEGKSLSETQIKAGKVILRPKKIGTLVIVPNEFKQRNTIVGVDAWIRKQLQEKIALAIDAAAYYGSGNEYEPLGLANRDGIKIISIGTNGGLFDFDTALDMQAYTMETDSYDENGNNGWLMHTKVMNRMRKIRIANYSAQTDGTYVTPPLMSVKKLREMLGENMQYTTLLRDDLTKNAGTNLCEAYYGNWENMFVGFWNGLKFAVSDDYKFNTDEYAIRVTQECDINVAHIESFSYCKDADPAA